MDRQGRAYLHAIAAVLIWSTVASAFKLTLRAMTPVQLLFYSSAVSTSVLIGVLAAQGRLRTLFGCARRDYARSAALGLLNPFLYYIVLFRAYDLLPAQEAQPLNYTWAVVLALLSIPLLGQRIGARSLAAVAVSYLGVLVIATRGDPLGLRFADPEGVSLALGSTVIWALFWILNLRDRRDAVLNLSLVFAFGLVPVAALTAATDGFAVREPIGLAGAVYVGVLEMGFTFVLWLRALALSRDTARVGILIFLSPFISLVLIHHLVGETILASSVVGLVLIVGGILLQKAEEIGPGGGKSRRTRTAGAG